MKEKDAQSQNSQMTSVISVKLKSKACWSLLITAVSWLKSILWFLFGEEHSLGFYYQGFYKILQDWYEGGAWPHPVFLTLNFVAIIFAMFELSYNSYTWKIKIAVAVGIVLNIIYYVGLFVYVYLFAIYVLPSPNP